jgi:hypothetical protein
VTATSVCNAWGVGYYFITPAGRTHTLVEHWNGRSWRIQASPNPGGSSRLQDVAATSASNAWAVGQGPSAPLIEHWNGHAWKVHPSANPAPSVLLGVAATSASNAWAVGFHSSAPLIEHWNGHAWKVQPSACPASADTCELTAVAATSASNAWAVGTEHDRTAGGVNLMLIEHWDGHAWKVQTSPNPPSDDGGGLTGVAATSATNAWAVGSYQRHGVGAVTFIERWNGSTWKIQSSPNPGARAAMSSTA